MVQSNKPLTETKKKKKRKKEGKLKQHVFLLNKFSKPKNADRRDSFLYTYNNLN